MQLTTMQDIAGCRGVLGTTAEVYDIVRRFRTSGSSKSTVIDIDDYIAKPAASGYRGVHLVTEYYDRPNDDKRLVEVQLRTRVQHDWAVGVENMGKRYGYALKQSEGPAELLDYLHILSRILEADEMGGRLTPGLRADLERARARVDDLLGGT